MIKRMDHIEYPKRLESLTEEALRYLIKDAKEAAEAMPEGPNAGYYLDEVNYAVNELYRRRRRAGLA